MATGASRRCGGWAGTALVLSGLVAVVPAAAWGDEAAVPASAADPRLRPGGAFTLAFPRLPVAEGPEVVGRFQAAPPPPLQKRLPDIDTSPFATGSIPPCAAAAAPPTQAPP